MTDSLDLDRRLRRLEDIEEIRRLRMQYHYFINEGLFDRVHELYTDDAIVDFGHIAKACGIGQIRELFPKIPENLQLVKQFIHNHMVDVRENEASGISYLDARYAQDGESVIVAACFREKYRRTSSGWLINETNLKLHFSVPIDVGWASVQLNYVKPLE